MGASAGIVNNSGMLATPKTFVQSTRPPHIINENAARSLRRHLLMRHLPKLIIFLRAVLSRKKGA
jgi:hypothetical protein